MRVDVIGRVEIDWVDLVAIHKAVEVDDLSLGGRGNPLRPSTPGALASQAPSMKVRL
jgi:hypothetical protein